MALKRLETDCDIYDLRYYLPERSSGRSITMRLSALRFVWASSPNDMHILQMNSVAVNINMCIFTVIDLDQAFLAHLRNDCV